jgi:hypothetical protein
VLENRNEEVQVRSRSSPLFGWEGKGSRGKGGSLGIPLIDDHSPSFKLSPVLPPCCRTFIGGNPIRQELVWNRMDVVVFDIPRDGCACGGEEVVGEDQAGVS